VPERERRAIEVAAGLPGARLRRPKPRFRHRGAGHAVEPSPRANREEVGQETLF
jgi:hypothetical protein